MATRTIEVAAKRGSLHLVHLFICQPHRVCRAPHGEGAVRPVEAARIHRSARRRENEPGIQLQPASSHAGQGVQVSQFVEPRRARNAAKAVAVQAVVPRFSIVTQCLGGSGTACRRPGQTVMPNPSLQPTRTGIGLGPRAAVVYPASRGPSPTPPRAAELER